MAVTSSVVISAKQRTCLVAALNEAVRECDSASNIEPYKSVLKQFESIPSDARYMSLPLFESSLQYEKTIEALKTTKAAKEDPQTADELIKRIQTTVTGVVL